MDFIKYKNANLRILYLNLNSLTPEQKEKIKGYLSLKNDSDLFKISYILSDKNGNFKKFFKNSENLEFAKRYLLGIPNIDSLEELNIMLNKFSDETIHIISTGDKNETNKLVQKFYQNSYLFSQNTFNFMSYKLGIYEMLSEERFKPILNKNEILIIFNKKYFDFSSSSVDISTNQNLFYFDKKTKQLKKIDKCNNDDINNNENFMLAYKFKLNGTDKEENFINFIQSLIEGESNQSNPNENVEEKKNQRIFPKRFFFTNNSDIANYYKLKFVSEKSKTVFVYVNAENLLKSKSQIDPEKINNIFLNTFEKFNCNSNNHDNHKYNKIRYVVTNNPNIAKIFNIFPKSNENITIRLIDYGLIIKYDENLKGGFKYFPLDEIKNINNENKNLIFFYKTVYNKKTINENELTEFLKSFTENEHSKKEEFLKLNQQYFESVNYSLNPNSKFKIVNANNFKQNFLDIPGRKILFCISENCIGCSSIKQVLEKFMPNMPKDINNSKNEISENVYDLDDELLSDMSNQNKLNENDPSRIDFPQVYLYDIMNETIFFQKVKRVPLLIVYDNNMKIKEIEVNSLLNDSKDISYENAIKEIILDNLVNDGDVVNKKL